MQSRPWIPEGIRRGCGRSTRPDVGDVVAYDRRAWDVTHVAAAELTSDEHNRLAAYRPEHRDQRAPYTVTLRRRHGQRYERENDRQEIGLRVRADAYNPLPVYPNGRVPLCSCHQHPWPCLEADAQHQAEEEAREAEKELALLPGCCPACQEPVTSRHRRTITFPGEYLRNPLAPANPTFHLRRRCYPSARRYEEAWVAADPTRKRSLLTLTCSGSVVVHHDGSGECFGATGSVCPTVHAHHRSMTACVAQTHGCGHGCPTEGHPGIQLAGRPSDPRDFRTPTPPSGTSAVDPHTETT